jgi:hypothetical protein
MFERMTPTGGVDCGMRISYLRNRRRAIGVRRQATGDRQESKGNRQQAIGDKLKAIEDKRWPS